MSGVVTVTINARSFRMACDEGQEDHLQGLAKSVDAKISLLRGAFGEIGEQRLTVMAAIMLADELHEASFNASQLDSLQSDVAAQNTGLAQTLNLAADEIEKLTARLGGK